MPSSNQVLFVQFLHPGSEHRPNAHGLKPWNTGPHRRTFVRQRGLYIKQANGKHGYENELQFWAEWETEAELIDRVPEPVHDGPKFVFRPFYVPRSSYARLANSDPFVFDGFYYSFCQQRGTMKRLDRGSVIIFGSCLRKRFVVDTVFVVADWQPHHDAKYKRIKAPRGCREVAIYPLHDGQKVKYPGCKRPDPSGFNRLYRGATWQQPVEGMFSYFPCVSSVQASGFARPVVRLPREITDHLLQGYKKTGPLKFDKIRAVWREVTRQVLAQGLSLGVYARMPSRLSSRRHPD